MSQRNSFITALLATGLMVLLSGCERPISDWSRLSAIKFEAQVLMKAHPPGAEVERATWPREIASLKPEFVMIDTAGVHITKRAYFDGGWGYFVPRSEGKVPEPVERFEEAGAGVDWWHPY